MKIAYIIVAYYDFHHLARLINKLNHPNTTFYLHIDQKVEFNLESFENDLDNTDNICFFEDRNTITWGGFKLIETIITMLKSCVEDDYYDYISLLSGQDYPLKNNRQINDFLRGHVEKQSIFMDVFSIPNKHWGGNAGRDRIEYYWLVDQLGLTESIRFARQQEQENSKRVFPVTLQPYGGSLWFTLPHAPAKYIYTYLEENPDILNFFKHTLLADELLIPTIIMNSPYATTVTGTNCRYIDFESGPDFPRTLTIDDFPAIIQMPDALFARKFDSIKSASLLSAIDERLIV